MSMVMDGKELSEAQIAAVNPVIAKYMQKARINKKAMESECLQAMIDAGCPLHPQDVERNLHGQ